MKLGTKLLIGFLIVGIAPFATVGLISLFSASDALEEKTFNQLSAIREIKKHQIEKFFEDRKSDMKVITESVKMMNTRAWGNIRDIQTRKIAGVKTIMTGMKYNLEQLASSRDGKDAYQDFKGYHDVMKTAPDGTLNVSTPEYQKLHEKWYKEVGVYIEDHGFYDIFFVCAKHGHVIFSGSKESDLGANVKHGPLRHEGLGKVWKKVVDSGKTSVEDFAPYTPSDGESAAFMGSPIRDTDGEMIAVAVLQLSHKDLNNVVQERSGLGQTGETYLVGEIDRKISFRSDMLTMGDGKYVVGHEISTPYIEKAIKGEKGEKVFYDSAGNPVLVFYSPLEIDGLNWVQTTKINLEECFSNKAQGETEDFLTKFNNEYGYYDLFLMNPDGYCFYSVTKEADYHTNLLNGKFANSGLGKLTKKVLNKRQYAVADFEPYEPSKGDPASFIAEPVISDGKVQLIVAMQLSLEKISDVMQLREGMGESGESYLVGQDYHMRSSSFLDPQNFSVKSSFKNNNLAKSEMISAALRGETDIVIGSDYTKTITKEDNIVLSAYTPLKFGDETWALVSEIDKSESFAMIYSLQWVMACIGLVGIVAIVISAKYITSLITKPIFKVVECLDKVADGDLTAYADVTSKDEIGYMAENLNKTVRKLCKVITDIRDASNQTAASSEEFSASSQNISQGAQTQATSVEEIAASVEELTASINQVAQSAQNSNNISQDTTHLAKNGCDTVDKSVEGMNLINESSTQISKIIGVINQIANQTNLLALNAAIEAASAGEHGMGFAVVAEEVRKLAERSSQATEEITELIGESTKRVMDGTQLSQEVGESLTSILTGVENTGESMELISKGTEEQAITANEVSKAIEGISAVTEENASSAEEMAASSEELSAQAQRLQGLVANFRINSEVTTASVQVQSTEQQPSWAEHDMSQKREPMQLAADSMEPECELSGALYQE